MKQMPVVIAQVTMIARRLHRILSKDSKKQGLKVTEHHTMMELYRLGGECGYEDLILATCFHKSTISKAVVSLEKKGWIESYTDPYDIYKKRVRILENGMAYAKTTSIEASGYEDLLFAQMSHEDRGKIYAYLERFYNAIRVEQSPDVFPSNVWPFLGHYCMNSVKYMEYASPLFQNEGREANQKHILMCLLWSDREEGFPYKQIEKMLGVAQSVIVRQIQKLEAMNLVESYGSENDRRAKYVKLTEKGQETAEKIGKVFLNVEKNGLSSFSRKEKKEMSKLLQEVILRMDAMILQE